MMATMGPFPRRALLLAAGSAILSVVPSRRARADHGGAPRSAGLGPVVVGILAAALTLAAGIIAVAIVTLLTRRPPPSE
jgi:hypothetical protein